MVLLGWGEVGAVVHPGFRGGQRRILGAGAWGRGFLVKLASWRILLDWGGGYSERDFRSASPPPAPAGPPRDSGEGRRICAHGVRDGGT